MSRQQAPSRPRPAIKKPANKFTQRTPLKRTQSVALTQAMKPEKHSFDVPINDLNLTLNVAVPLNLVTLGALNSQRIGNQIRISDINYRLKFDWTPLVFAGQATMPALRLMIVLDKQANGAAPAIEDVLTAGGTTAFRNMQQVTRFQVLHEDTFQFDTMIGASTAQAHGQAYKIWGKKAMNIPILFNDTVAGVAPTIANVKTNCIHMFLIFSGVIQSDLTYSGTVRIKFFQ